MILALGSPALEPVELEPAPLEQAELEQTAPELVVQVPPKPSETWVLLTSHPNYSRCSCLLS